MQTDIIGVTIGIIGIVIGVIVSYYFYKKSLRIKEPVYCIRSNNVISGAKSKYENLKVLYFKTAVENFTVSKILFFNQGSETITRNDIATSYSLRITTKDCELLDASVLQANKPSNNFSLSWDKSGEFVYIDFDYLDKNQGGVIQVAHTGLDSNNLEVQGDIVGVHKLIQIPANRLITNEVRRVNRFLLFFTPLILISAVISFLADWMSYATQFAAGDALMKTLVDALMMSIILFGVGLWFVKFTGIAFFSPLVPNSVIPNGLEKFLE